MRCPGLLIECTSVLFLAGCVGQEVVVSSDAATDAADGSAPADALSGSEVGQAAVDGSGEGATARDPAAAFVGAWKVTQGSSLVTCPGAPMYPPAGVAQSDVGGITQIRLGPSPRTIVATQQMAGCSFTYEVSGNVATLGAATACIPNVPVAVGCSDDGGVDPWYDGGGRAYDGGASPSVWTLQSETLTLSPDGTAIGDVYDEALAGFLSYCEDNTIIRYDCEAAAGGDVWARQ